jgi:ABC-type multidrug transport system ATPase subunit
MTAIAVDARPDSTPPLLSVSSLAVRFGALRALDGVDLTVQPGELVALAGENGAGKTTLVRCIAGDIAPTSGRILLSGMPVLAEPLSVARQGVAVVWQDLALCDNLDVASNLLLGRERRRHLLSDTRFHAAAAALLDELGIPLDDTTRGARALSGGQRQLLAVARAMARKPSLLLLDEPSASLGVRAAKQVEELIVALRDRGTAVLLACHDIEQMFRLAERIVVLRHGRVVADLDPAGAHPDDVVAMLSGQQVDWSARRQLTRLHGLVDRLVSADPSSSLSLILSALGAALGSQRLCIHLRQDNALVCAASIGIPPALLSAWSRLPSGPAGGPAGLAAVTGQPVVQDTAQPGGAWAPFSDLARAAKVASSWSVPVMGPGGLAGVITVFRAITGAPPRDQLDLVTLYAGYAASAIERDRLLDEVTARNRVLETIREMLETLAGPVPVAEGIVVALQSLRWGLQADEVVLLSQDGTAAPRVRRAGRGAGRRRCGRAVPARHRESGHRRDPPGRRGEAAARCGRRAVPRGDVRRSGRPRRTGRELVRQADHRGCDRADGGRRALAPAGARARGSRACPPGGGGAAPVAGTTARLPFPAQPRAPHPAHRDQGLRLQPDAAGRHLGRRLAAAVPVPHRGGVGPARQAGRRPARLLRHRIRRSPPAA